MGQGVPQRSFAGGELSGALHGRVDLARYQTGVRLARNLIVQRTGALQKRPGTKYLGPVKNQSQGATLVPYIDEANDASYILEFGNLYIRFWYHDALVKVAGVPYEVVTPYLIADCPTLYPSQFGNVITIDHKTYAPRELIRLAHTNWSLSTITFAPSIAAPANPVGVAGASGGLNIIYCVTAVKAGTFEESYQSDSVGLSACAKPTELHPNQVSWDAVADAVEYNIYASYYDLGIFGWIGRAAPGSLHFYDIGYVPDYNISPPRPADNPTTTGVAATPLFTGTGNYPSIVANHQQRTFHAATKNYPETVWGSQIGAPHNFTSALPVQDDDAIQFLIASDQISGVRHLVSLNELLLMSDAGEWRIFGDDQGTLKPAAINPRQDSYYRASPNVRPVRVGDAILFVQARGSGVRVIQFNQGVAGLTGEDLSLFASHLVRGYTMQQLAFTAEPFAVAWLVRSDGILIGCTYVPEQEIVAWHRHLTGASGRGEDVCVDWDRFESLAVLPNNPTNLDRLYMTVRRFIGTDRTTEVCYVERLADPFYPETTPIEDAVFVDAGITYDGAATATITGLSHLDGMHVAVLADGAVVSDGDPTDPATPVVSGGSITLPSAASIVQVGLPIRYPETQLLPLDSASAAIRDRRKRVANVTIGLYGSGDAVKVGPDPTRLTKWRRELWQPSRTWRTGDLELAVEATFANDGSVWIRHSDPLPFTLTHVIRNADIGG